MIWSLTRKDSIDLCWENVIVTINVQVCEKVASTPADESAFVVDRNSGTSRTRITFGANIASTDRIVCIYVRD